MTASQSAQVSKKIGFAGEQILSYIDEITKLPCPRCGEAELSVDFVGTNNIIIRCCMDLADYYANEESRSKDKPYLCTYQAVIRKANINAPPFTLNIGEDTKRGTAKNSKPPARKAGRPRKVAR